MSFPKDGVEDHLGTHRTGTFLNAQRVGVVLPVTSVDVDDHPKSPFPVFPGPDIETEVPETKASDDRW